MTALSYGPFISREQAKKQGVIRFYTGKPCSYGHLSSRYTSNNLCHSCLQVRLAETQARRITQGPTISRKQAIRQGLQFYFTGKPCKHGHLDMRRTTDSICQTCNRQYSQRYVDEQRDAILKAP